MYSIIVDNKILSTIKKGRVDTMNTNKKINWITRTALLLAVALIAQFIGSNMGGQLVGQLVTGTIVNMALMIAGIIVGISSGITIAIFSPLLAFFLGILKFAPAIPVVMAGNLAIMLLAVLVYKRLSGLIKNPVADKICVLFGMTAAAFIKCGIMWLSALYILPLFVPKVPEALVASFALPQAVTGTMGGIMSLIVIPALLKSKRTD